MASNETKRMACLRIFQLLKKHTRPAIAGSGSEHIVLTQTEIANLLEKEYNIVLERKAISNYLGDLESSDIGVVKTNKGAYYDSCGKDLTEGELFLLIDLVISSKCIDTKATRKIVDKLCDLASVHFKREVKKHRTVELDNNEPQDTLDTIGLLLEAMSLNRMVELMVNDYGADKALHPIGAQKISPYRLTIYRGKYQLIAYNRGKEIRYFIDRLTDIKITNTPRQIPLEVLACLDRFIPTGTELTLSVEKEAIGTLIDGLGKDFRLCGMKDERILVRIKREWEGVRDFIISSSPQIILVSPASLRGELYGYALKMLDSYRDEQPKKSTKE